MSVEDAKRAIDIGASAILLSNHGGRQLDGSRSPFDQLPAIKEAVGDKLEIILDVVILLTPDYPFFCKRFLIIDDYFTTYNTHNVKLVHEPVDLT